MSQKRIIRREILSETKQLAIKLGSRGKEVGKCAACEGDSPMFLPEIAAEVLPLNSREIYRLIETEDIHIEELNKKQILVCVKSLSEFVDRDNFKLKTKIV